MRVHGRSRRRRLIVAGLAGLGTVALTATVAWGVKSSADTVVIHGAQFTAWDTQNHANNDCQTSDAFSPVDDGSWGKGVNEASDAFDGGLELVVNTTGFNDGDGVINLKRVDRYGVAGSASGLRVSESVRALQTSPTLRLLVQLKNNGAAAKARDLFLTSNLGSDNQTAIRATSSGDASFTTADRWLVTSDNATNPGDPPVTHVLYGRGAATKVVEVVDAPGTPGPKVDCMTVRYHLNVPAHAARYLLFFAEMNNAASNQPAINSAQKFNRRHLNDNLLSGIGDKLRHKIRNWDL